MSSNFIVHMAETFSCLMPGEIAPPWGIPKTVTASSTETSMQVLNPKIELQ
jgi:hypothetical protein